MSCYERERGEIKLSVAEYGRVKKEMIAVKQKCAEDAYINALKLYDRMITAAKGKRGVDWRSLYNELQIIAGSRDSWSFTPSVHLDPDGKFFLSMNYENKRPPKPKKKDYIVKIDRKKFYLSFEEASISFMDTNRTIIWNVSENNHSRERAREHSIARSFFKILNSVKWTRGTGGSIVANDEYNQDDREHGGGGNYEVDSYGPERKEKRSFARY